MTAKTLVTVVTEKTIDSPALVTAIDLATTWDAHLDIIPLVFNRMHPGFNYTELSATVLETGLQEARDTAHMLTERIKEITQPYATLRYTIDPIVAPVGALYQTLGQHIRFADLAILPRPYGPTGMDCAVDAVETTLFDAKLPVLIIPPECKTWTAPKRVVLGWNESQESLNAARAAIPILSGTDITYVTVIDPPTHGAQRSDPGGFISQMLSRHGIRCEVDVMAKSLPRIADVLLRQVADRDADMLVMGAYGRNRWSEAMFGGATRNILEQSSVPVFLAH